MSNNDTTSTPEDGGSGEPEQEPDQTIEFAADVVFKALELRRLIEEAEVGLSETQRQEIHDILDERGGDGGDSGGGLKEEDVLRLIRENTPDGGLTEEDVRRIIEESQPSEGVAETRVREIVDERVGESGIDDVRPAVEEATGRVHTSLDELDSTLSRQVGPPVSALESLPVEHSNPGWGIQFTAHEPLRLGRTHYKANRAGEINVELYDYRNGTVQNLVATKQIDVPRAGVHPVTLDFRVPTGQYLLTRDWTAHPGDERNVSLARHQYDGWASDSGEEITLHGGAHPEFADNTRYYYWHGLHVHSDLNAAETE